MKKLKILKKLEIFVITAQFVADSKENCGELQLPFVLKEFTWRQICLFIKLLNHFFSDIVEIKKKRKFLPKNLIHFTFLSFYLLT